MASFSGKVSLTVALFLLSLCCHSVQGEISCAKLPRKKCAFAVDSSGRRCVLETTAFRGGYHCDTSDIIVENKVGHIESEECIKACGLDRNSVGISSDTLLEAEFTGKLCSTACYKYCPNIIDLYYNLAAGEGAFLADACASHRKHPHRSLAVLNYGEAALMSPSPSPSPNDPMKDIHVIIRRSMVVRNPNRPGRKSSKKSRKDESFEPPPFDGGPLPGDGAERVYYPQRKAPKIMS